MSLIFILFLERAMVIIRLLRTLWKLCVHPDSYSSICCVPMVIEESTLTLLGARRPVAMFTGQEGWLDVSSGLINVVSVSRIFTRSTASVCFLALDSSLWCATISSWRPSFVAARYPRSWVHICRLRAHLTTEKVAELCLSDLLLQDHIA